MTGHPDWTKLACEKCGLQVQVPSAHINITHSLNTGSLQAFAKGEAEFWALRNGGEGELTCPFHGPSMAYFLHPVTP